MTATASPCASPTSGTTTRALVPLLRQRKLGVRRERADAPPLSPASTTCRSPRPSANSAGRRAGARRSPGLERARFVGDRACALSSRRDAVGDLSPALSSGAVDEARPWSCRRPALPEFSMVAAHSGIVLSAFGRSCGDSPRELLVWPWTGSAARCRSTRAVGRDHCLGHAAGARFGDQGFEYLDLSRCWQVLLTWVCFSGWPPSKTVFGGGCGVSTCVNLPWFFVARKYT